MTIVIISLLILILLVCGHYLSEIRSEIIMQRRTQDTMQKIMIEEIKKLQFTGNARLSKPTSIKLNGLATGKEGTGSGVTITQGIR
jgi:hypothetical protein